jgi:hypothetical protein
MAEQTTKAILPWDNDELGKLLRQHIAHGTEAVKLDFKVEVQYKTKDQKSDLLTDITAIANSYDEINGDYGFIVYGVKPKAIIGISATEADPDRFQNDIEQLLREYIFPMPIVYFTNFEEPTGEKWGALVIAPRNDKPYMFFKQLQACLDPSKNREKGDWFIRKGATNNPGLPEDLARITQKQTDILIAPLQDGIRSLQDRIGKVENQYDAALFRVVTKAVSIMEGEKSVEIQENIAVNDVAEVVIEPPVRSKFPAAQAKDGPARFRAANESLGFEDDSFGENEREVFLTKGPAMWLRLMPTVNPQREWPTRELRRVALEKSHLLPLQHPAGGYSYLRASDGEGMYRANGDKTDPKKVEIESATFAFKTGEIWSIETALLSWNKDMLYSTEIEKAFVVGIGNYGLFLKELGISAPFHWKAGLIGTKGRHLAYPPPPGHNWLRENGPICATDIIEAEGQLDDGQNPTRALLPFFEKIFEECGRERPDYLPH